MESLLGNTRKPDIAFYRDGHINITARIAKSLHIQEGDVVDIMKQDRELYLYVKMKSRDVVGQHTGRCRSTTPHKGYRNFRTNCKRLCDAIFGICGDSNIVQLAAGECIDIPDIGLAVPLITRINLYKDDKRD
jgi:anaerobic selenocysteine-containing dehydrogenase